MGGKSMQTLATVKIIVLVLMLHCNAAPTGNVTVNEFGRNFTTGEVGMETVTLLSANVSTTTTDSTQAFPCRTPSWYEMCIGCGSFVGGVCTGMGAFWCAIRKLKKSEMRAETLSSCGKSTKKTDCLCRFNLGNVIHQVPDLFSFNSKKNAMTLPSSSGGKTSMGSQNISHLQRLLSTQTTYSGDRLPFVTQFSDIVTSEGGEVLSPDSDVSVVIPPGAIPEGRMQLIYVNVSFDLQEFGVSTGPGEYQLTPVVECLAPGLDRFLLPVTVKIPHRADISVPGKPWQFNVTYSQSPVGNQMNWYSVPKQCDSQLCDVTYTKDADFVYIRTHHFTTFTCTGCGKRAHPPLKLSAVVYGNEKTLDGRQQVNLRVYICDASTDIQKRITTMERSINGSQLSQFKPLSVHNDKDWEIELTSVRDEKWPWTLIDQEERVKTIGMDVCYHCCSSPPSVDYRVTPRDGSVTLTGMEAVFSVAQRRRNRADMVFTQLVTHDFRFPEALIGVRCHAGMESKHINYIKRHLPPKDMPRVARALGLSDVDVETIKRDHKDNSMEQVHQMIALWVTRKGQGATCRAFCESLEREEIRNVVDGLRRIGL